MPQFTNRDRMIVQQEQSLWNASQILLGEAESIETCWQERLRKLADETTAIAREIRDYNNQFEEDNE